MSERRGWRSHPLVQLTLVRYREFIREPEAVFWVFVFPVLLTAGLGIAFRQQGLPRTPVVVVDDGARARQVVRALEQSPVLTVRALSDSAAIQSLRTGKAALAVVP